MDVKDSSRMGSLDSESSKNHLKLDLSKIGAKTDGSQSCEELEVKGSDVKELEPVVV